MAEISDKAKEAIESAVVKEFATCMSDMRKAIGPVMARIVEASGHQVLLAQNMAIQSSNQVHAAMNMAMIQTVHAGTTGKGPSTKKPVRKLTTPKAG